jgi:hypothetical protein
VRGVEVRHPLRGLIAFAIAIAGCKDAPSTARDAGDAAPVSIATPDGLVLKVALRDPDAMWGRLQHGAGGAFALLPPQVGAIAAAVLGPDASFAADADGHATSYAAVAVRPNEAPLGWALAMPMGGTLIASGDAGAAGVWAREPGWLVVASDGGALASIGPYVTHRLPLDTSLASAAPLSAVMPAAAIDGVLAPAASDRWGGARAWLRDRARTEREAHGGRAPDFGDPEAIVAVIDGVVEGAIARLAHTGDVRIEGDAADADLTFDVTTQTPDAHAGGDAGEESADGAAPTPGESGDARPLASVADGASFAVFVRAGLDARLARAHDLAGDLIQVLRVEDDASRTSIGAAFEGWARTQGDWVTLALPSDRGDAVVVRTPSASAPASRRAVHDVLALARLPPLRRLLRAWLDLRPPAFQATAAEGEATFAAGPGGRPASVAWRVADGELAVGAGTDAGAAFAPSPPQGHDAGVLASLPDGVAFALVARPLRLGRMGALAPPAPVIVAAGQHGSTAWVRVDLADAILSEGVRLGGGLF